VTFLALSAVYSPSICGLNLCVKVDVEFVTNLVDAQVFSTIGVF
jgi:hypothetical protein